SLGLPRQRVAPARRAGDADVVVVDRPGCGLDENHRIVIAGVADAGRGTNIAVVRAGAVGHEEAGAAAIAVVDLDVHDFVGIDPYTSGRLGEPERVVHEVGEGTHLVVVYLP